ncbi:far upstream element-binding protein [Niveomyces insectorum RCEF 264]|uniref:Far upstream element-binding protein n=1 Tax=Niveomyces insectorum RCEF 264 TaxID=1081102 RepID=A0A167QU44_9HYPO|nr:far upstream element-binding protein [Niveomyces insectorum RCEF 264]
MADTNNLESILATLGQYQAYPPPSATGYPGQSQGPPGVPPPAGATGYPTTLSPSSYGYPKPTSSGSLDLSAAVQPTASGNVSIQEAVARAKAHAAQNGVTPYDRPIVYGAPAAAPAPPMLSDSRRYRSSRSRSPAPRGGGGGDGYRDGHNPYRDERREEQRRDATAATIISPGRGGGRGGRDDNVESIEIQANLVGLIIGRQGENLRRVEAETQCRVQFIAAADPSEETRQCKITGAPAQRAEAKAAIYKIIEESGIGNGPPGRGGGGGGRGGYGGVAAPAEVRAPWS